MTDPVTGTIRLTQPTVGGDAGSWGTILNSNLAYTDTAINGITSISLTSNTYTLEATGDSGDQARSEWYSFTGSPGANCTVTLPANTKVGIASNGVTGGYSVIMTTGSGTTVSIDNGSTVMFYCDGTNVKLVPWGSPGTLPALSVSGATTLTTSEKGSYVEVAINSNYILGLPTPVNNAGDSYLINFLSGTGTATLSTPAGSITGGYGLGTKTALYVAGPVFMIVSDGTNWVTQGNAAVTATTISATGAVTFGSTLNVTGSTSFAGNVTVAGTLNAGVLSGTSTTSSLSVGGTSNFVGSATFSSNVNALGTITAAVIDVTGTSSLVGNVTAGANVIVTGTVTSAGEKNTGTATMAVLDVTGTSSQVGNATFGSDIIATGTVTSAGAKNTGTATMAVLDVTGTSSQVGNATFGANIIATGTVTSAGEKNTGTATMAVLDVTGTSSQVGLAIFGANQQITGTSTMAVLDVTGTSSQVGNATFGAAINVGGTSTFTAAIDPLSGIYGITTNALVSGEIGYVTTGTLGPSAIGALTNLGSIVLGPGAWLLSGCIALYPTGTGNLINCGFSGTSTSFTVGQPTVLEGVTFINYQQYPVPNLIVNNTATTTYYGLAQMGYTTGTGSASLIYQTVRIG